MAYVPGCTADVFISYARRDNQDGWVSRLKDRLTQKLNPFLAGRAEVWFDDRLRTGTDFRDEIHQKLKDTSVFVAIVSPSFLDSEFCITEELEWFLNQGGRNIIQLVKVPLEDGQDVPLPSEHYRLLHHPANGHLLEGESLDAVLNDVVDDISNRLRQLKEKRPKLYLSQVRNENVKSHWDALKACLHAEGFGVLPKGVLPSRLPEGPIRKWLNEALVSLHHTGSTVEDALAALQLEIARKAGRPTVLVPELPSVDHNWTSVLAEVQRQLEVTRKPAVYLIYDYHSDHQRMASLPEFIHGHTGCEVFLPESGEKYHKFRLEASDGVLLFRGEAPDEWLRSQEQSLLQTAARRAAKQAMEARYFAMRGNSGSAGGVQVRHGARQELIIERSGEPDFTDLRPFLDAVQARVRAWGGAA